MKFLLLVLSLTLFVSCNEEKVKASKAEAKPAETIEASAPTAGIAEENNMCICTKDYRPVCGKNGVTYPNPCQAGCDKVEVASDGPCEENK